MLKHGLSTLASVGLSKGVDFLKDWVKDKTGIELDVNKPLSNEQIIALKQAELLHEQELMKYALEEKRISAQTEQTAITSITERHKADMVSDSWLSKNVRPMVLALLTATLIIATFSAVEASKYDKLCYAMEIVFGYYFVGRTIEKRPFDNLMRNRR